MQRLLHSNNHLLTGSQLFYSYKVKPVEKSKSGIYTETFNMMPQAGNGKVEVKFC